MGDIGNYLKREREAREISLQEISEKTKISIEFLRAIESNEFDKLPAEVFTIGFIRNYARYLGLNVDEVVNMYKEFRQEQKINEEKNVETKKKKRFPILLILGGIIALVVILIMASSGKKENENKIPAATSNANAPLPVTYPTSATYPTNSTDTTTTSSSKFTITLEGKNTGGRPVYIQYCADETCKHPRSNWKEAYLKENEKVQISGEKIIGVMADDAGKVLVYRNNGSPETLGKSGSIRVKFFRP